MCVYMMVYEQANLELTKLRIAREREDKTQDYDDEEDEIEEVGDGGTGSSKGMYTYSSAPTSYAMPVSARNPSSAPEVMSAGIARSPRAANTCTTTAAEVASPKTARSSRGWTEDDYELAGQGSNTVQLSLIESKIGECKASESEEDYCVEEADSDFEDELEA